jgi:hypothetical protein
MRVQRGKSDSGFFFFGFKIILREYLKFMCDEIFLIRKDLLISFKSQSSKITRICL